MHGGGGLTVPPPHTPSLKRLGHTPRLTTLLKNRSRATAPRPEGVYSTTPGPPHPEGVYSTTPLHAHPEARSVLYHSPPHPEGVYSTTPLHTRKECILYHSPPHPEGVYTLPLPSTPGLPILLLHPNAAHCIIVCAKNINNMNYTTDAN